MNTRTNIRNLSLLLAVGLPMAALADTLHVPADYTTIQAAIDASVDGDTVLVADGVYTGAGNRDMDFGGRAITVQSENGAGACIIDVAASEFDPARAFWFHSGETTASVLEGFTIRNAYAEPSGGAMYFEGGSGPLVRACTFRDNTVEATFNGPSGGAAAAIFQSDPEFVACDFVSNTVQAAELNTGAGAILCIESEAVFTDCSFVSNAVEGQGQGTGGGAIAIGGGAPAFERCVFEDNSSVGFAGAVLHANYNFLPSQTSYLSCSFRGNRSESRGGAIYVGWESGFDAVNCLFTDNESATQGAAVHLNNGTGTLTNCTMTLNIAGVSGGAIRADSLGHGTVVNSVLWANVPEEISAFLSGNVLATYSNVQGGWSGDGNTDSDPAFVDPAAGDFSLAAGSPCIDQADNTAVPVGVMTDLAGNARFVDDPGTADGGVAGGAGGQMIVDMGTYEYQGDACYADFNGDGAVNTQDVLAYLNAWTAGDPSADCNSDGAVNTQDVLCFLNAWNAGC